MNSRSGINVLHRLAERYFTHPLGTAEQRQESFLSHEHTLEPILLEEAMKEIAAAKREMEVAVDKILTVAERLMARENAPGSADDDSLEAECFAIFEACAFQDITGQRLSKALKKVEQAMAVNEVHTQQQSLWAKPKRETGTGTRPVESDEEGLLNGPALPGAGLDQDAVNNLLKNGTDK